MEEFGSEVFSSNCDFIFFTQPRHFQVGNRNFNMICDFIFFTQIMIKFWLPTWKWRGWQFFFLFKYFYTFFLCFWVLQWSRMKCLFHPLMFDWHNLQYTCSALEEKTLLPNSSTFDSLVLFMYLQNFDFSFTCCCVSYAEMLFSWAVTK